jgi:hypothetical protein
VARSALQTRNGGDFGFEATLWQAADKLRGNLDASDYKHVVLGLIFLKYISDAFEEKRSALANDRDADPEDRDEYLAVNVFWVPTEARWAKLQAEAKQPTIGKTLDDAMTAIERDNPRLKGRAAEGVRPTCARQTAAWGTHRSGRNNRPRGRVEPLEGRPGASVRILPRAVRILRR